MRGRAILRVKCVASAALIAALALACDGKSGGGPGTQNPGAPGQAGAPGATASAGGAGAAAGASAGAEENCDPALDEAPTRFFRGRLYMRMPAGLELVEFNPFLAMVEDTGHTGACGLAIRFAAVGYLRADGPVSQLRDRVLHFRGIPTEALQWSAEASADATYAGVYEAAAGKSADQRPVRGKLELRRGPRGAIYYFIFETSPEAWEATEPTVSAAMATVDLPAVEGD